MQMRDLRHWGARRGMCNPLQPAHSPALSEGLGGPRLDQGAPQGGQESFLDPRKRFWVPFSTLEALLSTHLGFSESSTSLGSRKVDRSPKPRFLFGVGGSGRRPSRIRRPRRACGVVEKRGEELVGEV